MRYGSGNKTLDLANQHAARVRRMLYFLDHRITVESLRGAENRLGEDWLRNFNKAPNTKKAYLNSLDHFLNYIERENLEGLSRRDVEVLRLDRLGWLKSLRRDSHHHIASRVVLEEGKH